MKGGWMRKAVVALSSLFLCFSLFKVGVVVAEEAVVAETEVAANTEQQAASEVGWKEQISKTVSNCKSKKKI